ncbi:MAG: class SAM-dependent methyltransferase [Frankiales bacterium]|nr:class SAM-dependent methyltransferase [Frankiales bacterium]
MSGLLSRLVASTDPRLRLLLDTAAKTRDRLDHPQLRDARRLLAARDVDLLMLGESVSVFVSPTDTDQRPLPAMVADALPGRRTVSVQGGGYHAGLLTELVRIAPAPRVLVVSLWTRGRLKPWIEHPRFGHHDALERLRALPGGPTRGSLRREDDFASYYAVPHSSLAGATTIGEHALPLKQRSLPPDEALALLYAFHHGAPVMQLEAVTALGRACRDKGSSFFAYQAPISVRTGERALGPRFRRLVDDNLAAMAEAFRTGAGQDATVLATASLFGEDEFVDPSDGSEHLNERGRRRLASLIADEVRARL